ncbi:dihydropyrimidine dehydrogenase [Halorientalis sp. IM1011]|uniref:tRNA-dihydrouridine synthase n=1 Tax=Halorientalis sp. IM1011 TaxID=1932360 RepID=UPI00097CD41C|nr:tRNA-dihydrouridine synthase [Halorientalis sp. IM1011]AQL44127.1 dihydropyrimidine dehydrogenase [Halorientalis sp. IM1011]
MTAPSPPEPLDFRPRVALASLSGESDAEWAAAGSEYAGAAVLGGIALDEPTREAARELVDRDRTEFLPADPVAFVDEQLAALSDVPIQSGFNARTTEMTPLRDVARVCRDRDAFVEINAHCRQDEMCAAGAGESLLRDPDRLCEQVREAAETGAAVSVKVRTEVPGVDLPALAERAEAAGADAVHVDAMDSESVVGEVAAATGLFVIANNEVRDRESVREYLDYGADAVSVGRPSDEPAVLERVREATRAWFAGEVEP